MVTDVHRDPEPVGLDPSRTGVVLVTGIGRDGAAWDLLRRSLSRRGFRHVSVVHQMPGSSVMDQAEHLGAHVDAAARLDDITRFRIVGHNVAGLAVRTYVCLGGGTRQVDTVITVATPHHGTMTDLHGGPPASEIRPGSWLLRRLDRARPSARTRWINYLSGRDVLVRPRTSALLSRPGEHVENIVVHGQGDLSLTLVPAVRRSIQHRLEAPSHSTEPPAEIDLRDPLAFGDDPLFSHQRQAAMAASKARHPSRTD